MGSNPFRSKVERGLQVQGLQPTKSKTSKTAKSMKTVKCSSSMFAIGRRHNRAEKQQQMLRMAVALPIPQNQLRRQSPPIVVFGPRGAEVGCSDIMTGAIPSAPTVNPRNLCQSTFCIQRGRRMQNPKVEKAAVSDTCGGRNAGLSVLVFKGGICWRESPAAVAQTNFVTKWSQLNF